MTDKEIKILADACRMAGIDARKIKPQNPFDKTGTTASLLQAAVSELHPAQAAMWRVAAGGSLSLATLAELQSGSELSASAQQDLWNHDPAFVADVVKQRKGNEETLLAQFEAEADKMRRKREGDAEVDRQDAKAKADQQARAESAEHARQLQQRIDQRRANTDRMAGQVIQ